MTRKTKELIVGLIGASGVVVLLLGLLAETYDFMLGLVIAIGIWLVSGLLARYWGVPKRSLDDGVRYASHARQINPFLPLHVATIAKPRLAEPPQSSTRADN